MSRYRSTMPRDDASANNYTRAEIKLAIDQRVLPEIRALSAKIVTPDELRRAALEDSAWARDRNYFDARIKSVEKFSDSSEQRLRNIESSLARIEAALSVRGFRTQGTIGGGP